MGIFPIILISTGLVIGLPLLADALTSQAAGDKLISDIEGVKLDEVKLDRSVFTLDTVNTNPTNKDLTLNYIFLDLYVGDKKLAEIREENVGKTLKANAITKYKLKFHIKYIGLAQVLFEMIKNWSLPDKIKIKGYVKANEYKVEYDDEYPLKS